MIIATFFGRILILPGFSFAGSWQHIVLFQRISGTAPGAEQLRELTVVSCKPTVAICRNSYLACGYLKSWGVVLLSSRDSPVFKQPPKNTPDVPFVDLGNHSKQPMKLPKGREIFPSNKSLLVVEGTDVEQCARVNVTWIFATSKRAHIAKSNN